MYKVFSGIRPSGKLHLGNYLGAIKSWIELQNRYKCIYAVVDLHGITTPFKPREFSANTKDLILDLFALGFNPKKSPLILQSAVSEHLDLAWIFSSITPTSWLSKIPTYKEKTRQHPKYVNLGLLSYPVLMAADILVYKADLVPVGEDQLPHIELTNKIARRFNKMFGQTFHDVKPILTKGARIMSLQDPTKKMSKTGDEGIALSDPPSEIERKISKAVTDSGKEIIYDLQKKPAISNLLTIYNLLSGMEIKKIEQKYKDKGYATFKKDLAEVVIKFLGPFQEKRKELEKKKGYIEKVILNGVAQAKKIAQETILEVKEKVGIGL
jgi:tryptophanyl-tRNA synthetase